MISIMVVGMIAVTALNRGTRKMEEQSRSKKTQVGEVAS